MMKELKVYPASVMAACSPLVVGDLVFVVTGNGVGRRTHKLPSPKAPSFVAVDKKTGKVVWKDNSPGDNIMDGQWSNPAYAEVNGKPQVIFPGGDGWLYGFEPEDRQADLEVRLQPEGGDVQAGRPGDQELLRRHAGRVTTTRSTSASARTRSTAPASAISGASTSRRPATCRPTCDRRQTIRPEGRSRTRTPAWSGTTAARSSRKTGRIGRDYHFGRTISTVAVHDGLVYAAELDGYLHCLDARPGKQYWEHDLKAGVWGSPYWVDGKVYIGTEDGDVYIFAARQGEAELRSKIDMEQSIKDHAGRRQRRAVRDDASRQLFAIGEAIDSMKRCTAQQTILWSLVLGTPAGRSGRPGRAIRRPGDRQGPGLSHRGC